MKLTNFLFILFIIHFSNGDRPKRTIIAATAARFLLGGGGGGQQPSSAVQGVQQLFQTKARLVPFTGQVVTGLTGMATVKRDLLSQLQTMGAQAISQAATRVLANAAATAQPNLMITNHDFGAQQGLNGGWSTMQNLVYQAPVAAPLASPLAYPGSFDTMSAYSIPVAQVLPQPKVSAGIPQSFDHTNPSLLSTMLSVLPASRDVYNAVFSDASQPLETSSNFRDVYMAATSGVNRPYKSRYPILLPKPSPAHLKNKHERRPQHKRPVQNRRPKESFFQKDCKDSSACKKQKVVMPPPRAQGGRQFDKQKEIYTTLPEYVFRVGERPDIFLSPED